MRLARARSTGLRRLYSSAAAAAAFTLTDAFTADSTGLLYDPLVSTLWQNTGGAVPVADDGDSVARADDQSGDGANATQATASKRPVYKTDGSIERLLLDGVDDHLVLTFPSGQRTSDMRAYFALRVAATQFVPFGDDAITAYFGLGQDGSTSSPHALAGTPTYRVDGSALSSPNRDDIHTALADDAWHILEVRNLDLTNAAWDTAVIGDFRTSSPTSWAYEGSMGALMILKSSEAATHHDDIMSLLADRYGITL